MMRVADELDLDVPSVPGLERQVLVPNISLLLQVSECGQAERDVADQPDIPEMLTQQLRVRIAQQVEQERVRVEDVPVVRVEDEDAILGGLEEPPISDFGSLEPLALLID